MGQRISRIMNLANSTAKVMLLVLMILGSVDVIGRYTFNKPVWGTFEFNQILLAGIVFFSLAYTLAVGGHIKVDLVVSRLHPRVQAAIDFFTSFLMLILFALLAWQSAIIAIRYWKAGRLVSLILINAAPFQGFVTLGALLLCLELIVQMIHYAGQIRKVE